jgi:formylglycine-generating enzyme required for sulfatase activity
MSAAAGSAEHRYRTKYYTVSPAAHPTGPASGALNVVRGGSWHHGYGRNATRYNHTPESRGMFLGFRCVRPAGPESRSK